MKYMQTPVFVCCHALQNSPLQVCAIGSAFLLLLEVPLKLTFWNHVLGSQKLY